MQNFFIVLLCSFFLFACNNATKSDEKQIRLQVQDSVKAYLRKNKPSFLIQDSSNFFKFKKMEGIQNAVRMPLKYRIFYQTTVVDTTYEIDPETGQMKSKKPKMIYKAKIEVWLDSLLRVTQADLVQ